MKYRWWSKSQLSWGMVLICHLNILEFCEKHLISITMYSRKKNVCKCLFMSYQESILVLVPFASCCGKSVKMGETPYISKYHFPVHFNQVLKPFSFGI